MVEIGIEPVTTMQTYLCLIPCRLDFTLPAPIDLGAFLPLGAQINRPPIECRQLVEAEPDKTICAFDSQSGDPACCPRYPHGPAGPSAGSRLGTTVPGAHQRVGPPRARFTMLQLRAALVPNCVRP